MSLHYQSGPKAARVMCTGRLYCDLVMSGLSGAPEAGREVYADGLVLAAGGGAYISAAYFAALGRPSSLAAVLPAEPFAGAIAAELAMSGIDLAACELAPAGADPQITVAMITGGDRAFVTRRTGPAMPGTLHRLIAEKAFDHLHIGELASLIEMPEIAAAAKAQGITVSADCAWDAQMLARPDLVACLANVDVFLPNRAEADALMRHAPLESYAGLVVVKDGRNGATAHRGGEATHRPVQSVEVVDTVGAGDAFNAGFLDRWLEGAVLADCLDAGAYAAAVALGRRGGAGGLGRLPKYRTAAE